MKQTNLFGLAFMLSLSLTGIALAGDIDPATVPGPKQTIAKDYLSAKEAATLKQSLGVQALLIDIRTQSEFTFVGAADMTDANIPYMVADYSAWDDKNSRFQLSPNSGFLTKMSDVTAKAGLDKSSTIILLCRSGDRSSRAADLLHNAGYTKVYSVVEGFEGDVAKEGENKGKRTVNGWKNAGFPWSYTSNKSKMYIE